MIARCLLALVAGFALSCAGGNPCAVTTATVSLTAKKPADDRVVYFARVLWKGSYTASYVARATTAGTFVRPPAHAEEMYNQSLGGRSEGGTFTVVPRR